jgi:hypothetical protein
MKLKNLHIAKQVNNSNCNYDSAFILNKDVKELCDILFINALTRGHDMNASKMVQSFKTQDTTSYKTNIYLGSIIMKLLKLIKQFFATGFYDDAQIKALQIKLKPKIVSRVRRAKYNYEVTFSIPMETMQDYATSVCHNGEWTHHGTAYNIALGLGKCILDDMMIIGKNNSIENKSIEL